jgi:GTPase
VARVALPDPGSRTPEPHTACGSCALHNTAHLKKLGVDPGGYDYVAAVAGNPNTGKSTVFNALTGLRQHVGNWPGKTVSRAEGRFTYRESSYKLVDLPGTYSLLSASGDEDVARDFLLFGCPDVTVAVVDATRLERNLNLVLQILQITNRVVVALNLMDEARRHRISVDARHLARELGVPVAAMSARRGEGLADLLDSVEQVAQGRAAFTGARVAHDAQLEKAVTDLAKHLDREFRGLANTRWIALRLLEGDAGAEQAVRDGTLRELSSIVSAEGPAPAGPSGPALR